MKLTQILLAGMFILALASCGGENSSKEFKKVMVYASGKISNNNGDVLFSISPSNQHNEQEFDVTGKTSFQAKYGDETLSFDVNEPGYYILNLKKDTLVGSLVNFGGEGMVSKLSAEDVDNMIDSTQKLLSGENASDANRTYNIVPKSIKNVGNSASIQVYGPYSNIPYEIKLDKDGNAPEILKFFTNPQRRKALDELNERLRK